MFINMKGQGNLVFSLTCLLWGIWKRPVPTAVPGGQFDVLNGRQCGPHELSFGDLLRLRIARKLDFQKCDYGLIFIPPPPLNV